MNINKMEADQKKAQKFMKDGKSHLNTHIFKWKPNYIEAAPKFMEASTLFENVGQFDLAIQCYEKLALCHEKLDDLQGAADAYNKIGFIIMDRKKDPNAAHQYLIKSVNLFKIHGNTLKAQEMLKKLGKRCFEQHFEDLGSQIYNSLIDELFEDQNYGTGCEIIPEQLNFLIDKGKYSEAIDLYTRHIKYLKEVNKYEYMVCRSWLAIICVYVIMGEYYVAEEKLGTFGTQIEKPMNSDEYVAALNLIDSIQKKDPAAFAKCIKRPIFSQIETNLLKKLKKYNLPNQEEVKKEENPLFGNIKSQEEKKDVPSVEKGNEEKKLTAQEPLEETKEVPKDKPKEEKEAGELEKPEIKKVEEKVPEPEGGLFV